MSRGNKALIGIKSNNPKHRSNPLIAFIEGPQELAEKVFTSVPQLTDWADTMLEGAAVDEIEKLAPVSENQLKSIFPRATATMLKDPLKRADKIRIHENLRREPGTALALFTFSYFFLGKDTTISLGLNRKYANEQRKKQAMMEIQNNPEYLDTIEEIMNRDDDLDMHTRQIELIASGSAFGRSVAVRQYDNQYLPKRYIPLSSPRLGRVWVDKHTWEFLGVEYNDYASDKRILLAKDIIHYECNDFQFTPNTRYHGMSMLESTMALGEYNRVANEITKPEIGRTMWAPIMLVKVNTKSINKLNEVKNAFQNGKTVFYNDDITVTVVTLTHDLEKITATVKENTKDIYRSMTVPLGVGFQDEQNRATLEGTLQQWYDGVLQFKRSHFDSVMWLQHYKPQLERIQELRFGEKIANYGGMINYLEQNAISLVKQKERLPFRIVTEFTNINTSGFLDRSAAMLGYYDKGLVNGDIARTETGLGKYNDDMAEEDQKKIILRNDMMQQETDMIQAQPITGPTPGIPTTRSVA